MGFHEVVFPESIAYGATGGPQFMTRIAGSVGGDEQRTVMWDRPRLRYNVATGVQSEEQMQALAAFFRARKGRAYGFRFHDWMDDAAVSEYLGMGNGERTAFPLVKRYESGMDVVLRRIHKPVAESVTVFRDGEEASGGVTVDTVTGMLHFAVPPEEGEIIAASFRFHVPVRFDNDRLEMVLLGQRSYQWREIPLVELRLGE